MLNLVTQLALATDGAVAGVALAYVAIRAWCKYLSTCRALDKIRHAPIVPISGLRELVQGRSDDPPLLIVRGLVQPKSVMVDGSHLLQSYNSSEKAVVVQNTQSCLYNDSRGVLAWTAGDLGLAKSLRNPKSTSLRVIPFVLVSDSNDYLVVNLDGSTHPLPLTTVFHHLQPVPTTTFTFLQALFGHSYPVGLLDEEKILPVGKEITALGVVTLQQGTPHIHSSPDLPFFLSDITKDQLLLHLAHNSKLFFWFGIVLGSASLAVFTYAFTKNWRRFKEWRDQRQLRQSRIDETDLDMLQETEEIPDGQLCVICLMRRKRSAFVPCGHFVCCHRCALSVERDSAPKCPLCRQTIRTSVRIYDS